MDYRTFRRIADPRDYPGVVLGYGVILYGQVKISAGANIGDYCVLGAPTDEYIKKSYPLESTTIGRYAIIGPHSVVYNNARIMDRVVIEEGCSVGCESIIGAGTRLLYRAQVHWKVKIGKKCIIGGFCCDRAIIQDNVKMFGKLIHRMENPHQPWNTEEPSPTINKGALVAFNTLVVGGVTVGANARILAGAIVRKDAPKGKQFARKGR